MNVTPKSTFMYSVYTIIKYFTMVHQNWKKNMHSLKAFFELRAYTEMLELLLEFSYLLYHKDMQYAHWSWVFFQSLSLADFHKLRSQLNNQAMEVLRLCQDWRKNSTYLALHLCRFRENI